MAAWLEKRRPRPVSRRSVDTDEPDVRPLLTKLEAGELDVGIVYVTDVNASGGESRGRHPRRAQRRRRPTRSPRCKKSKQKKGAADFLGFVRRPGRRVPARTRASFLPASVGMTQRRRPGPRPTRPARVGRRRDGPSFPSRSSDSSSGRPWSNLADIVTGDRTTDALVLSLVTATTATAIALGARAAAGMGSRPGRPARTVAAEGPRDPSDDPAARRRGRRAAVRLRSEGLRRPVARVDASASSCPSRRPVSCSPRHSSRCPSSSSRSRAACVPRTARYEDAAATLGPAAGSSLRHVTLAGDRAVDRRRHRAVLGAGARRVRRDDHLRRQPPGSNPDGAARHPRRPGRGPRCGHRVEPRAHRDRAHGAARPQEPAHQRVPVSLEAAIGLSLGDLDRRRSARCRRRRSRRPPRPQRCRQDDDPACHRRAPAARHPASSSSTANVLDDPAAGTFVPPNRRPIGVVFQDNLLFPKMTAVDNVAFGLRARGRAAGRRTGRGDAMARAARLAASGRPPSGRALRGTGPAGGVGSRSRDPAQPAAARRTAGRSRRRDPGRRQGRAPAAARVVQRHPGSRHP